MTKNMYELADFAGDKLGRKVYFDSSLSMTEKTERSLNYGNLLLNAFENTEEAIFLMLAKSFLGRIENDLCYHIGTDEQIIAIMDKNLYVTKKLQEIRCENEPLNRVFYRYPENSRNDIFRFNLEYRSNATGCRRAELLKNPDYKAVLDKYR